MGVEIITFSELEAFNILLSAGVKGFYIGTNSKEAKDAGDFIIVLADKIKSERQTNL